VEIRNCTALVTGANRGLGKAYVEALLAAGARKVYAGVRDPASIGNPDVIPLRLDVTVPEQVAAAASTCRDVNLLINNAGVMLATPILDGGAEAALRKEMEVNVFGVLAMALAFGPILAKNGGGAIANMLSVASWYVYPFNATYCVSKHAALAVTNALRVQFKSQATQVIGVYAGFIDTDMAEAVKGKKTLPAHVAARTLAGIQSGHNHVYADAAADAIRAMAAEPERLETLSQQLWDDKQAWTV
jgi:NAD(P)-dependent dehydrogenase (short-subunit alcohol dehydrogenase family)